MKVCGDLTISNEETYVLGIMDSVQDFDEFDPKEIHPLEVKPEWEAMLNAAATKVGLGNVDCKWYGVVQYG